MLKSLLIANRGEIACRIIETCKRLGVRTVAVYSDADVYARHVAMADEAVHIGASPATESYLQAGRIIEAAKVSGAEAIHPGYGFLSENADFAEAVAKAGLIWVGPTAATIRSMGLKDEAKRIAEEAGVPVLPGYRGEAQDAATLEGEAERIGYPLLIKAVAGGGGRGIRLVARKEDLAGELESAVREAKSSFGDGRVMLEKLVEQPRHIEVQVFGDSHGDAVHLYERDCSLQRRRQKVVEEAPAPGMPEDVRAAMTGAAVDLAKAVGYQGAGTVEFIVDGTRPLAKDTFFFLEMNTRLQVEHPVTELITGTDLVEWQLRVASGEKLPLKQGDIPLNGHAIEARICAEDPADNFRPGAGRLYAFNLGNVERLSESSAGAPADALDGDLTLYRLDSGFGAGDTVPAVYDSMIAKAIVKSWDRESAIDALSESLGESIIAGIPSNVGFLKRCLDHPVFRGGEHHVNWIAEEIDALTQAKTDIREAAGRLVAHALLTDTGDTPFDQKDGWRLNAPAHRSIRLKLDGEIADIAVDARDPVMEIMPAISITDHSFAVAVDGDTVLVDIPDYEAEAEAIAGGDKVSAPMPGKVIDLRVQPGDEVTKDQTLAVMEAMKMEHSLKAPRDGIVKAVGASVGEQVAEGVMLVELEEV
ncbi:acetyl/propionyl/methylcrotonyl-CoA carboxylase subunit alpha [Henriciella algicola]|uniref:Acetyl/propionyl/methylcrotonyl-CoA carboxylase subunit alpha n=1 Tax=Henriciella algicola TaxID=1608422 RepID=A0A399RGW8_9PROT|nr:acetyl/propionyl/methylcrotonyl-CoA carboxylase subunit alpha [Henriciella algicola]RIJ30880.1 acetyl/propionyl/methylcrotonyl-CoA carboxylase subunit alpha [Henriciella algicola]